MILKTLRWKTGAFDRLVNYIGKESDRPGSFQVLHNLRAGETLQDIAGQFRENDSFRKPRKNGTVVFHEILSFHKDDRDRISGDTLEDIAREYLAIRAPRSLGFAMAHLDEQHVHIHIAVSGSEYRSPRASRMDNAEFSRVRRQIELYQITHYPELENSVVYLTKPTRSREVKKEMEAEQPAIQQCYDSASSLDDFFARVSEMGLDESKYLVDMKTGQTSFNIDTSSLEQLESRMMEMKELQRAKKEMNLGDDFGRER